MDQNITEKFISSLVLDVEQRESQESAKIMK